METAKKFIPAWLLKFIRPYYHGALSLLAHFYYGRPSKKLVVVGVTGTAGKSTTITMLAHLLNDNNKKCGYITTVGFFDGNESFVNKHGRSMPGRFLLQKQLRQILNNNCRYALVEVTSEGLMQNRHLGIQFDMVVLTNLGQAHLDAHGGFENYKKAKGKLFKYLSRTSVKSAFSKKTMVVNLDTKDTDFFFSFKADQKIGAVFDVAASATVMGKSELSDIYIGEGLSLDSGDCYFKLRDVDFKVLLPGEFNAKNALLAVVCANTLKVDLKDCAKALATFSGVLGRMQEIPNSRGIKVILDYAPEPVAMENVLTACSVMPHERLIHVFGSTGGHRDVGKRFEFGKISARFADIIFITNDDVYDSDPEEIARDVKKGIDQQQPKKVREVNILLDRRQAIAKALNIAKPGDLVLITGKGSEQFLVLPENRKINWDEASVVRELL